MKASLTQIIILLSWTLFAPSSWSRTVEDVHTLISEWQVGEARTTLQPLLNASPSDIELRFAHGRLLFFEGRYRESLDVLDAVKGDLGTRLPDSIKSFHSRVRDTMSSSFIQ